MVTAEELEMRREAIRASGDLQALLAFLADRARSARNAPLELPAEKALLSRAGGVCPKDGAPLGFDPASPRAHRCTRCGATATGERYDRHWVRYQHLWLAERAAHFAALAALGGDHAAAARSRDLLVAYGARYLSYPNVDNVLGPSRLFFSTYLESLWLCNFLAAATLLREAELCDEATVSAVATVADEAATLIGEFDEGFSNRQAWNNAALLAIAAWFEDEALAERALDSPSGLLAHMARGFGRDGLWYEGENYHLFALRAVLLGGTWARHAGVDVWADPRARARLAAALRAPAATALPDLTYPARKDSRFGVSLAQPAYVEVWEVGLAALGASGGDPGATDVRAWLHALYAAPPVRAELMDAYLHDAPLDQAPRAASRTRLSWWSLVAMEPTLEPAPPWAPTSQLFASQGLAVLRAPRRYVSLECGPSGGGHGHADRLSLTLHADGVLWLADPGTTSYVVPELGWYRGTLAHNAPRVDGVSQASTPATCEAFEEKGEWAWVRGRWGDLTRTVVNGPAYVLDVLEFTGSEEHLIELPWHVWEGRVETPGRWEAASLPDPFVSGVERFVPGGDGNIALVGEVGEARARFLMTPHSELWRVEGPGRPGAAREAFYLARARGRAAQFVTVVETGGRAIQVVRMRGGVIEVEAAGGVERHAAALGAWKVEGTGLTVRLGGRREPEPPFEPWLEVDAPRRVVGSAIRVSQAPVLDGTLAGFDTGDPLTLDLEDQYRRSEEPYAGPDEFRAAAYVNWDDDALFIAVDVVKRDPSFRPADAPPLELDNEPDDIHSDGVQLYVQDPDTRDIRGVLVVPEGMDQGRVRVAGVGGAADPGVRGSWHRTPEGYCVTVALPWNRARAHVGAQIGFDLLINLSEPGRVRRAGQLVWSGGGGWVWLRGDRQAVERFGLLELVG